MLCHFLSHSLCFQAWQGLSRVYTKSFDFRSSAVLIGNIQCFRQLPFLLFHFFYFIDDFPIAAFLIRSHARCQADIAQPVEQRVHAPLKPRLFTRFAQQDGAHEIAHHAHKEVDGDFLIRPVELRTHRQVVWVFNISEYALDVGLSVISLDDLRAVPVVPIRHQDAPSQRFLDLFKTLLVHMELYNA